jgi:glycine dehydrogenase
MDIRDRFSTRHLGPSVADQASMLKTVGARDLEDLVKQAAPASILTHKDLDIGVGLSERQFLEKARSVAKKNKVYRSHIGLGYYGTFTPPVILRNILENPGWYTAYTPYQAEISQGRMEALLNFQTMIMDLTGLPMANASLLDEATAAAEAMAMSFHSQKKNPRTQILVDSNIWPQTLEILQTRAEPLGIEVKKVDVANITDFSLAFAVYVQFPTATGEIATYETLGEKAHAAGTHLIVGADILSLCLLKPPGEWGADIVIGSSQRFGVPMGFGGPHAAYMAVKEEFTRLMPGRIIGVSKDTHGNPALRLALQTREQHIRREKATSNICTAQVLLAVMASMYAVYHGPDGLREIAKNVHLRAAQLAAGLAALGYTLRHTHFFDTVCVSFASPDEVKKALAAFQAEEINLGRWDEKNLLVAIDETTDADDIEKLLHVFATLKGKKWDNLKATQLTEKIPASMKRTSPYLTHPNFNSFHSETEMLRYIHRLEQKDLSLNQAMIPLGSCTMKLNATSEMIPITWPEFANLHPFAPLDQAQGYLEMIHQLENWLCQITGFAGVSLQPNAGSQGEYAGLLVIRAFQKSRGENRNICLIPTSAHGTNPASAVMAGLDVVAVKCDNQGNVDVNDLREKAKLHASNLAALMITYPSTHGVFEDSIKEICEVIHQNGGQVYMDGANFNALVGTAKPGEFGPDVCHLNLHKTFCIPHGGGGPGIGPIGVAAHLKPYLPKHSVVPECGPKTGIGAVSAAPWGSAAILPISWAYIAMMGTQGLKEATQVAILNANYIAKKLSAHFPVLYRGRGGWVAHECIIDVRQLKTSADVSVDDIAKRLMDYGFHAPTMSWPVAGTLMIEPTESESLEEIERFCQALIQIREEIREIESGQADKLNNVLKNAPHSMSHVTADKWDHPYTREKAAYPLAWVRQHKFWPSVSRVDNVYGDRNLVCSCPPMDPTYGIS